MSLKRKLYIVLTYWRQKEKTRNKKSVSCSRREADSSHPERRLIKIKQPSDAKVVFVSTETCIKPTVDRKKDFDDLPAKKNKIKLAKRYKNSTGNRRIAKQIGSSVCDQRSKTRIESRARRKFLYNLTIKRVFTYIHRSILLGHNPTN